MAVDNVSSNRKSMTKSKEIEESQKSSGISPSYMSFHDLTLNSTHLYVSPSAKDIIGWDSDDLVGKTAGILIHPEDAANIQKLVVSNQNPTNQPVAQLLRIRIKHKYPNQGQNGYVLMDVLTNICYDCTVCIATKAIDGDKRNLAWRTSADDLLTFSDGGTVSVESWNKYSRTRNFLTEQFDWEAQMPPMEPRTVFILNRFTLDLVILYASLACQLVMDNASENLIGRSLYDFMSPSALNDIQKQIEYLKESEQILRVKFDWINKSTGEVKEVNIPVEAMFTVTCDGIVCIIRRNG